ncbi:unnamed protein product, partial [Rhizoctonia solani]
MLGLDLSGTGPLHILSETNEMDGDSAECTDDLLSIRGLIDGIDTEIGLLEKTERLCEVALGTCKPGCWRGKLDMGEMEPTEGREPGRTVLGSCEAGKIRPGSIAVDPDMMEEMDSRRERKLDGLWPGHVKSGGDMVENTVEATEDIIGYGLDRGGSNSLNVDANVGLARSNAMSKVQFVPQYSHSGTAGAWARFIAVISLTASVAV